MTTSVTTTTDERGIQVTTIHDTDITAMGTGEPTALTGVFRNVFHYAGFCELNFKNNMMGRYPDLEDTTFTSDLSIAEYCEQAHIDDAEITEAVEDTIVRAVREWGTNEDYIIALLFAVNMKSWEHYAMTNDENAPLRAFSKEVHEQYSRYYADRYHSLYSYVMAFLFAGKEHETTRSKIWRALD